MPIQGRNAQINKYIDTINDYLLRMNQMTFERNTTREYQRKALENQLKGLEAEAQKNREYLNLQDEQVRARTEQAHKNEIERMQLELDNFIAKQEPLQRMQLRIEQAERMKADPDVIANLKMQQADLHKAYTRAWLATLPKETKAIIPDIEAAVPYFSENTLLQVGLKGTDLAQTKMTTDLGWAQNKTKREEIAADLMGKTMESDEKRKANWLKQIERLQGFINGTQTINSSTDVNVNPSSLIDSEDSIAQADEKIVGSMKAYKISPYSEANQSYALMQLQKIANRIIEGETPSPLVQRYLATLWNAYKPRYTETEELMRRKKIEAASGPQPGAKTSWKEGEAPPVKKEKPGPPSQTIRASEFLESSIGYPGVTVGGEETGYMDPEVFMNKTEAEIADQLKVFLEQNIDKYRDMISKTAKKYGLSLDEILNAGAARIKAASTAISQAATKRLTGRPGGE